MTAQVAADLRAAADVLERDGWTQGALLDTETGARCAYGAICSALDRRMEDSENDDAFISAADQLGRFLGRAPAVWNDEPGRTAAEVIAALRAAADRAEAEQ